MARSIRANIASYSPSDALIIEPHLGTALLEYMDSTGLASGISADLYTEDGVSRAIKHCSDTFGRAPDIAIANVYGTDRHNFESASNETFRDGYERIVMSAASLARAVLPSMKAQRWGRIVTIRAAFYPNRDSR